MKHTGNLIITKENAKNYTTLTKVEGNLYIQADVTLKALTSVDGNIVIAENVGLNTPNLKI